MITVPMYQSKAGLYLLALLVTISARGEERSWHEIRSPHFRVITNGSERAGRHVARAFEQMRTIFADNFPGYRLDSAEPLVILAPEDEPSTRKLLPEFWKHSGPKPAGEYFNSWEQPYALVRLDAIGANDDFSVVYHEYVHSLLHLNLHWLPTWLDEGMAEFYANTRFEANRTFIGAPPKEMGRLNLLRFRAPIPLAKLIEQRGAFTRSEEDTALYYGESWALTHYLTLGPGMSGGEKLRKFFNAIQRGPHSRRPFRTPSAISHKLRRISTTTFTGSRSRRVSSREE